MFELQRMIRRYDWENKAWKKNSGLNGIQTHDLSDTGAVLYQLSYQAIILPSSNIWTLIYSLVITNSHSDQGPVSRKTR